MRANDVRSTDAVRHGAYVAVRLWPGDAAARAGEAVAALVVRLGRVNEFDAQGGDPPSAVAFLRRVDAVAGARDDEGLRQADAVVHVAAPTAAPVAEFCAELPRLVGPAAAPRVLGGVVRPMTYTGNAMHNFAYAHRVLQQPGRVMRRKELLERVSDRDGDDSDRSVDVHIVALRRKLGDDPRTPRYIRTVRSVGYLLIDPARPS